MGEENWETKNGARSKIGSENHQTGSGLLTSLTAEGVLWRLESNGQGMVGEVWKRLVLRPVFRAV